MDVLRHRWLLLVATLALLATGCGSAGAPPTTGAAAATASDRSNTCPEVLPQEKGDDDGFGTTQDATSAPRLARPDAAWTCAYGLHEGGTGEDAPSSWRLTGQAWPLEPDALAALADSVQALGPPEHPDDQVCPANLGPKVMFVLSSDEGLTGLVVDAFGCIEMRLTDDPFTHPAGTTSGRGTVPGLVGLAGPLPLPKVLLTRISEPVPRQPADPDVPGPVAPVLPGSASSASSPSR